MHSSKINKRRDKMTDNIQKMEDKRVPQGRKGLPSAKRQICGRGQRRASKNG